MHGYNNKKIEKLFESQNDSNIKLIEDSGIQITPTFLENVNIIRDDEMNQHRYVRMLICVMFAIFCSNCYWQY